MGTDAVAVGGTDERGRVFRTRSLLVSVLLISALVIVAVLKLKAVPQLTPSTLPEGIVSWQLFFGCSAALVLIGILIRLISTQALITVVFGTALFLGAWTYAWFILPWDFALLFASALTIVQARIRRVPVHNAFVLIGAAGIAIHFAFLFQLKALAAILAAFLMYDLAFARRGGAIVAAAGAAIRRGVIPGIVIPANWKEAKGKLSEAVASDDAVLLGAGDCILPFTLVARAAMSGAAQAIFVASGIVLGALFLGSRSSLRPAPALVWLLLGGAIPFAALVIANVL